MLVLLMLATNYWQNFILILLSWNMQYQIEYWSVTPHEMLEISLCHAEFREHKIYLLFLSFLNIKIMPEVESLPGGKLLVENKALTILHIWYQNSWWLGHFSLDISIHSFTLLSQVIMVSAPEGLTNAILVSMAWICNNITEYCRMYFFIPKIPVSGAEVFI